MKEWKRLENELRRQNIEYLKENKAFCQKNETSAVITKQGARLVSSPLDFCGIKYPGIPYMFDAKCTSSTTSFPLSNIADHQLMQMKFSEKLGGWGGIIVRFYNVDAADIYVLPYTRLMKETATRKSIPLENIQDCKTTVENYLEKIKTTRKDLEEFLKELK